MEEKILFEMIQLIKNVCDKKHDTIYKNFENHFYILPTINVTNKLMFSFQNLKDNVFLNIVFEKEKDHYIDLSYMKNNTLIEFDLNEFQTEPVYQLFFNDDFKKLYNYTNKLLKKITIINNKKKPSDLNKDEIENINEIFFLLKDRIDFNNQEVYLSKIKNFNSIKSFYSSLKYSCSLNKNFFDLSEEEKDIYSLKYDESFEQQTRISKLLNYFSK